jgi:hypothetical protein
MISSEELEYRVRDGTTLLCKYSIQQDALRVIMTALGTQEVLYFRRVPNGLVSNDGILYLSPSALRAMKEQVSILTVSDLFDYNGRKMSEWQPLLDMLKEVNATITEANGNVNPDDYDIVFWDACREDNSILFPRIRNLIRNGKVIIITGTNSCSTAGRNSSQIANDVLRDFGLELTMDDLGSVIANSTGKHTIMNGVGSFLTFRSPNIKINDDSNVLPLANNGKNILLAVYEDKASKGLLIANGLGENFLFGVYDPSSKAYDHKCLLIMKNIILYAKSVSGKK